MKLLNSGVSSILLLVFYFAGCAGSTSQVINSGTWGGEHIVMIVTDSTTTLDYDCAHGSIDEFIKTNEEGDFEVTGVYIREKGGPIRIEDVPDKHAAIYSGNINGNNMTLIVRLTDLDAVIDTFFLTFGSDPVIYKCY